MGVLSRVGGVVLRAAAVIGVWWGWEAAHQGEPPTDDMSVVAVLSVLTALAVLVWGVADGIRGPASRAAVTWMLVLLCLVVVPVVAVPILGGRPLHGPDLFVIVLIGGAGLFVVLVPALVGAALGAGIRLLATKS